MTSEIKYQVNKTIRFKLNPCSRTDLKLKLNTEEEYNLQKLVNLLTSVKTGVAHILYQTNGEEDVEKKTFNSKIKVKYTWLRSYLKNDFYDNRKDDSREKSYSISNLEYVQTEFRDRWLKEWSFIIKELSHHKERPNEDLIRKPDTAQIISQCLKRSNFEFIKEFVFSLENVNDDLNLDKDIEELKRQITYAEKELSVAREAFLPYQSNGVIVAGGSFNYYTVNKGSKFCTKEAIESSIAEECDKLKNRLTSFVIISDLLRELDILEELKSLSLDDAYHFLREWKAEKKSAFIEKAQNKELTIADIGSSGLFSIFNASQEDFNHFKQLTDEIEQLATEKNHKETSAERKMELRDLIIAKKKKRGEFFNAPKCPVQTQNYHEVCELFKILALKRGQIIARLKGIEKEANTAEQINHWCFIVDHQNKQYLYMVPRTGGENLMLSSS